MTKYIYSFDDFKTLKDKLGSLDEVQNVLGEKATHLSELKFIDIQIPAGFIISSECYPKFIENNLNQFPEEIWKEIKLNISNIEKTSGFKFGDSQHPLFLSCRCDAPLAMPGMLDSVLYIGLTDVTVRALEKMSKNRGFVWDSYRRLVQGYGTVVLKIPFESFDDLLENFRISRRYPSTAEFTDLDWIEITKLFKSVIMRKTGNPFPQDPQEQLKRILNSAYASFNSERAKLYRDFIKMPDTCAPSMIVSQMAFGNNGPKSCAAILYTRNPMNGSSTIYGEYSTNALIEDVSRGLCHFKEFSNLKGDLSESEYNKIKTTTEKIEKHFKEPQMIDFVVESDKVFVLQTRSLAFQSVARFTAVKDMAESGLITKDEALSIIRPDDLKQLMLPQLQPSADNVIPEPFCTGSVAAGNGTVLGRICLSADSVYKCKTKPIFVCKELLPKDFKAYLKCTAVVTAKGSNSSHASLIARQLMSTAVVNCEGLIINTEKKTITCKDVTLKEHDILTVTGDGKVIKGKQAIGIPLGFDNKAAEGILSWADSARKGKLDIFSVVTTAKEAGATAALGADGVGMFPIESLFEGSKSSMLVRALSDKRRDQALKKIEPAVQKMVQDMLVEAKDIPVTIRLFKPTLNSFAQDLFELVEEVAKLKAKKETTDEEEFNEDKELDKKQNLLDEIKANKEINPLFGLKGIRLNLVQQDLLRVQLRGILSGIKAATESGVKPQGKILLPFVTNAAEVEQFRKIYDEISCELVTSASIGVEIENPRGCVAAATIAKEVDFVLIEPSELTESTFSCCQSYAESTFLKDYQQKKFISESPFDSIDLEAVGELMKICVKESKAAKGDMPVGIAGPLCGDPRSIAFFYSIGGNYITCPSTVVPIARLCSAQAVIKSSK